MIQFCQCANNTSIRANTFFSWIIRIRNAKFAPKTNLLIFPLKKQTKPSLGRIRQCLICNYFVVKVRCPMCNMELVTKYCRWFTVTELTVKFNRDFGWLPPPILLSIGLKEKIDLAYPIKTVAGKDSSRHKPP